MPYPVIQCCRIPQELVDIVLKEVSNDPKTLQSCSLVCWEWSLAAGRYIFSLFRWPPCTTNVARSFCEKNPTFSEDSSFTVLLQSLAASPRLCQSIHNLTLSHHVPGCAYSISENDEWLYSTFFRIITFLPNLKTLTIKGNGIHPPVSSDDLDLSKNHAFDVETLSIDCPASAVPYLLSAFRSVSRLVLGCQNVPDQPLLPAVTLKVQSVDISHTCKDEAVMTVLHHCLDITTVRHLKWYSGPGVARHPQMLSVIASMPSLESLTYDLGSRHQTRVIHREPQNHPRLRSITVRGEVQLLPVKAHRSHFEDDGWDDVDDSLEKPLEELLEEALSEIFGGGIYCSDWQAIFQDLRILVSPVTEDLTIRLSLLQQYKKTRNPAVGGGGGGGGGSDESELDESPGHGVRALRKGLATINWEGLQVALARGTALRSLRFAIERPGAATYNACVEVLRSILAQYLSEDVMAKVQFVDQTRRPILKIRL